MGVPLRKNKSCKISHKTLCNVYNSRGEFSVQTKFKHPVYVNLLAPEFYILILAHPVCKMWIIQEPQKVALWNKRHFEEKNGECAAFLKYSVLTFVEKNI